MCPLAGPIRLYFIITSRGFTREDVCLGSQAKSKNAEPHPAFTPRRRGAKKPRTGLRHRPEKGGASATPGRRSKSVASAPNPRTQAIAHGAPASSCRRLRDGRGDAVLHRVAECLREHGPGVTSIGKTYYSCKIAKTFPSFDERIGWSIHGAYDDEGLPVEVEERLSAFFRPHDDAFIEILGRRLAWRT